MGLITRVNDNKPTNAPVEIADEVEMFARENGRHATLHLVPLRDTKAVWLARFTLRADDPRMKAYQEGKVVDLPTEDVWFQKPNPNATRWQDEYDALDIVQMGAAGVRQFLQSGDVWSGQGKYKSLEDYVAEVRKDNTAKREKHYADTLANCKKRAVDKRRSNLGIPFLGVGIDLKKSTE